MRKKEAYFMKVSEKVVVLKTVYGYYHSIDSGLFVISTTLEEATKLTTKEEIAVAKKRLELQKIQYTIEEMKQ